MTQTRGERDHVSASEFEGLFRAVSTWGRWGQHDQRGALNELTPDRVTAAARLVREGVSVSLSLPLNTRAAADNPEPGLHRMDLPETPDGTTGSLQFFKDFVGSD